MSPSAARNEQVSGLSSNVATKLVLGDWDLFTRNLVQLVCFFAGAFLAAAVVGGHKKFFGGKHFSTVLTFIAAVVLAAALAGASGYGNNPPVATALVALAAGTQNGMMSFWSGAILRSTHVTGTVTDLGIEAANLLLGRQRSSWKLELMGSFYAGYVVGGVVGAAVAVAWSPLCEWLAEPISICHLP